MGDSPHPDRELTVEPCRDAALLNRIITHPKVYPHVADDYAPGPAAFDCSAAVAAQGVVFLLAKRGEQIMGCFMVQRHTMTLFEIHTCLLPECWGRAALSAARAARAWIFGNTSCRKLMTWVPTANRIAYRFALRAGMKDEGLSTKSYLKGGVLQDQHLLGMEG